MSEFAFEDIKAELIDIGYRVRQFFGPSQARIRERALEFGVTLTWNQENDVLLAAQRMDSGKSVEITSEINLLTPQRLVDAGAGNAAPPQLRRLKGWIHPKLKGSSWRRLQTVFSRRSIGLSKIIAYTNSRLGRA